MPGTFLAALPAAALAPGKAVGLVLREWPVLVAHTADGYFAVLNRCSHSGSTLSDGRVRRNLIQCPLHGAPFELATGQCKGSIIYPTIRTFAVRIVDDMVEVEVPEEAPTVHDLPVPTI